MMVNKRLIGMVGEAKKYVALNVVLQWCGLLSNIAMMTGIAHLLWRLYDGSAQMGHLIWTVVLLVCLFAVRFVCTVSAAKMSYLSSKGVKKILRQKLYDKLLKLGVSYKTKINTSEIVQVAVEGCEQLETYFGAYLPQFFYAMIAPITLFAYMSFINLPSAIVLLICVPLIPVSIAAVQTWAKKLLSKYWGQYAALGDTFLENLQGLTTLKIYEADGFKNNQMNCEAEKFRKITMKVLTMQLNSITIMDLIAYGGAALGIVMSVTQYVKGHVSLSGCLLIILLSADYFIPMRQLGSFFHIAMNGMAASERIFNILDLPENEEKPVCNISNFDISCKNVCFSYDEERKILSDVSMHISRGMFVSVVGESGCGKSTLASLLIGRNKNYVGSIKLGDIELSDLNEAQLLQHITYISHQSYLFKGTVKDNLLMGNSDASDEDMWSVLKQVRLDGFMQSQNGLETLVLEKGSNFSGGQCQRLALARALLHDSEIYIFDEATSNIDVESENAIMDEIHRLAHTKTVIVISHRLANTVNADMIYVMNNGTITEQGTHEQLISSNGHYSELWQAQQNLENFGRER